MVLSFMVGLFVSFATAEVFEGCHPLPLGGAATRWQCSSEKGDVCLTLTAATSKESGSLVLSYAREDELIAWFSHRPSWHLCSWSNRPGCYHSVISQRRSLWTARSRQVEKYPQPPIGPHIFQNRFRWDKGANRGFVRKTIQDLQSNHVVNPEEIMFSNCWELAPIGEVPSEDGELLGRR